MEFKLKQPIEVMDNDLGKYQEEQIVVVKFFGKKGLKALKSLQDVIFKTFQSTTSVKNSDEVVKKEKEKDVTTDEILTMLEMTGNSEQVFDSVFEKLKYFSTIGTSKLNEELQDQMHVDDLDNLYQGVLKNFLLEKVILRMNSLSK